MMPILSVCSIWETKLYKILKVLKIIYNFKLRTVITNFYLQSCLQLNILHCPCIISQFINIQTWTLIKVYNYSQACKFPPVLQYAVVELMHVLDSFHHNILHHLHATYSVIQRYSLVTLTKVIEHENSCTNSLSILSSHFWGWMTHLNSLFLHTVS